MIPVRFLGKKSNLFVFGKRENVFIFKRFYGAEDLKKNLKDETLMTETLRTKDEVKKNTCLSVSGCQKDRINRTRLTENDTFENSEISVSFHGRKLPEHLISLESREGQELFHESVSLGHAANFFSLITNFASQSDVSMCGPASLAMVLNALKLDPLRTWRRPWRWWSDEMFACCDGSLEVMKSSGVTLEFFDRIAKKQMGISVETRVPCNVEVFRDSLKQCATEQNVHVIVSFGRVSLGQTGIGHFSPVAAVHPKKDLVLVLDVARFKYPPYWVKIEDLYAAMKDVDPETGIPRGYSIIKKEEFK